MAFDSDQERYTSRSLRWLVSYTCSLQAIYLSRCTGVLCRQSVPRLRSDCFRHVALPIYTLAQNHRPPVYQQDASKVLRQMSTDFQRSFSSKFVIKLSLRIAHILNVFVFNSAMQRPAFLSNCVRLLLWPLYGIGQDIIFLPCGFYLSFFFSLPYLSGRPVRAPGQ